MRKSMNKRIKKPWGYVLSSVLLAPLPVSADMMDYGYRPYGWPMWMGILGVLYIAVAAFIFSIIFWLTHNWLVPTKGAEKTKRQAR